MIWKPGALPLLAQASITVVGRHQDRAIQAASGQVALTGGRTEHRKPSPAIRPIPPMTKARCARRLVGRTGRRAAQHANATCFGRFDNDDGATSFSRYAGTRGCSGTSRHRRWRPLYCRTFQRSQRRILPLRTGFEHQSWPLSCAGRRMGAGEACWPVGEGKDRPKIFRKFRSAVCHESAVVSQW